MQTHRNSTNVSACYSTNIRQGVTQQTLANQTLSCVIAWRRLAEYPAKTLVLFLCVCIKFNFVQVY